VAAATPGRYERSGLTAWPESPLPRVVESDVAGRRVVAYPSLIDEGETVGVRIMTNAADQERLMRGATRRLLLLAVPRAPAQVERRLRTALKPLGRRAPELPALAADCLTAATDRFLGARGGPAWDEESYRRLEDAARDRLAPLAVAAAGQAADIVLAAATLTDRLDQLDGLAKVAPALAPAAADMRSQLARLVDPGFVTATGLTRLPHLARYIEGINLRLAKLRDRPERDRELMTRVHVVEAAYDDLIAGLPPVRRAEPDVVDARWLLEELRVSLFAQTLGTAQPVSEQRLRRTLAALA
jgi:ATP-dependent helicase HrpA